MKEDKQFKNKAPRSERLTGEATTKVAGFEVRDKVRTRSYSVAQGAQKCKPSTWARTEHKLQRVNAEFERAGKRLERAKARKNKREKARMAKANKR